MSVLELPHSKHRWISACLTLSDASYYPNSTGTHSVILGDRKGSLHTYKLQFGDLGEASKPVHSQRVHGPNGVTCLKTHNSFIYSTGRDGYCRRYSLSQDGHLSELSKLKVNTVLDVHYYSHAVYQRCKATYCVHVVVI